MLTVLISLILLVNPCSAGLLDGKPNYDVVLKRIARCQHEGTQDILLKNMKLKILSRTKSTFSADGILKIPFNNEISLDLDIAEMKQGGEWKDHLYYLKSGTICTTARKLAPKFFSNLLKSGGFTDCPISPGNYTFRDMDMTIDLKIPYVPSGNYKVDFNLKRKDKLVGCIQLHLIVTPKKH